MALTKACLLREDSSCRVAPSAVPRHVVGLHQEMNQPVAAIAEDSPPVYGKDSRVQRSTTFTSTAGF